VLAGGIAHDFNNMLTAIIGFATLLQSKKLDHEKVVAHASEIAKTGTRAATLTRQLLAYSRKQVATLSTVDVNAVVDGATRMLSRVLGENHVLSTSLDSGIGKVRADSSQLEQVILNLVVNARDAMPDGGRILLSTCRRVLDIRDLETIAGMKCGPHVEISCADSGCGIDQKIIDHIFEPFFTTKEIGKGTGLGLSTVYGIVKGSGGHIRVTSEIGIGTSFRILLPELMICEDQPIVESRRQQSEVEA
jgi:signal transduction histidine kinase